MLGIGSAAANPLFQDGDLFGGQVFADLGRLRRLRLAIPEPIELADRLRAAGVPIEAAALTSQAIARELSNLDSKPTTDNRRPSGR